MPVSNLPRPWNQLPYLAVVVCLATLTYIVPAQTADPFPKPAIEYVIGAFGRYPLIALSAAHNSRNTMDFVHTLIRYPGFSGKVSDIVVEFGNARYQKGMDRYLSGESVTHEELKQVCNGSNFRVFR